jgi:hypothetical protein
VQGVQAAISKEIAENINGLMQKIELG